MNSLHTFQTHRARLFGLAYRMLGCRTDAEDVLQDAFLRWRDADVANVRSSEAWLTTTVARLAIDRLRRLKAEREVYFGPWLPEPLSQRDLHTPELAAELDDDVSIAFLTLLEKAVAAHRPLHGAERISWLWFVVARRRAGKPERRIVTVNGEPGLALYWHGRLHSVAAVETDGRLIHAYYTIANPDKLGSFPVELSDTAVTNAAGCAS